MIDPFSWATDEGAVAVCPFDSTRRTASTAIKTWPVHEPTQAYGLQALLGMLYLNNELGN